MNPFKVSNLCCGNQKNLKFFKIVIENHENERQYIEVDPLEKIREIKQKVFDNKVDPEKSQLYFQMKKLENDWTVKQSGLKDQCKLYLIFGENIRA
ncbi:unnamed protein product [Paramecium sonneborni]|nr:unnamed protein product [Paramecium sonneborni]